LLGNGTSPGTAGLNGINVQSAAEVNLENDVVQYFNDAGINFASSGGTSLNVTHCVIEGNAGGGIVVTGNGSTPHATIDGSEILGRGLDTGGPGVSVSGTARVSILNSTISGNQDGVFSTGAGAVAFVYDSQVVNNLGNGLHATASGAIDASGSTIAMNQLVGVLPAAGGGIGTFGTNILLRNVGGNGTFTGSDGSPQLRIHPIMRPPGR
jgi:hypothetical protein